MGHVGKCIDVSAALHKFISGCSSIISDRFSQCSHIERMQSHYMTAKSAQNNRSRGRFCELVHNQITLKFTQALSGIGNDKSPAMMREVFDGISSLLLSQPWIKEKTATL